MSHSRTARRHLLSAAAIAATLTLGLTACGPGTSGGPSTEASESPSASSSASATESASPSTSAPASPSTSASPTESESAEAQGAPTVFWVTEDLDAPGAVEFTGCGYAVLVERPVEGASASAIGEPDRVEAALEALFATEREVGDGLTNSLSNSELEVNSVSIDGDTTTVDLSGMPISAGTCDDPRIIAQLEHTTMANAGTEAVEIVVDGTPLAEFFDQRG